MIEAPVADVGSDIDEEPLRKPFFGELKAPIAIIGATIDETTTMQFIGQIVVSQKQGYGCGRVLFLHLPNDVTDSIHNLAGISQETLGKWSYYTFQRPWFYVEMSEPLKDLINENCIYSADEENQYFLEVLEDGRLFLNYEHIVGGRYLGKLTAGAVVALKSLCAVKLMDLQEKADPQYVKPVTVAPLAAGVIGELGTLQVSGQKIVLPDVQLQHYPAIKQLMLKAGGKYSKNSFSFPAGINPQEVMQSLLGGKKVNVQQETQSFFTPTELGCQVIGAVGDVKGKRLLEPSAGAAALADIAKQAGADVVVIENHPVNINQLVEKGYDVIERDFLTVSPDEIGLFDAIVANPPFSRNQDIDHVNHMWKFLKPGGVLSTITSTSWFNGTQKKQREFAEFLKENGACIEHIDAGAFKASGTIVPTIHVVVQKRKSQMQEQLFA